jgi:tetratricopeptide (TPR) repeat protein
MQVGRRRVLVLGAMALVLVGLGWLMLPRLVDRLPGEVRGRIPEPVLAILATPLPTALPAPQVAAQGSERLLAAPTPRVTPTEASSSPTPAPPEQQPATAGVAPTTYTPVPTRTPTATPEPSPTARPPAAATINGLKIVGQRFNNCGPANLTMVLTYHGDPSNQMAIAAAIRPHPDDRNVSPWELAHYVNEMTDLEARTFWGGDLGLLKRLLSAGYPVIIEKGLIPSEWQGWMGHYLTLTGYDDGEGVFQVLDSYLGPWDGSYRRDRYKELDALWVQFNRAFIVVHERSDAQAVDALLGPDLLDEATMWRAAAETARVELRSDPDDAFAWFNLGSSLTRLGALGEPGVHEDAATAFDRAREIGLPWRMLWYQFDPYEAYLAEGRFDDVLTLTQSTMSGGGWTVEETHLYHGHAQLATGNASLAEAAYRRALALNPNLTAAAEALLQLASRE